MLELRANHVRDRGHFTRGNFTAAAPLLHVGPELADFDDTAAVLAGCDLVIAVDTSVAHLAGALGRPMWLLLPFTPIRTVGNTLVIKFDDTPGTRRRLIRKLFTGDYNNEVTQVSISHIARALYIKLFS